MTGLREVADRLRRTKPLAILSLERLFATERAAAALAGRRLDGGERTAAQRTLRQRLVGVLAAADAGAVIAEALAAERRSVDRAIVHAYLAALPSNHPAFETLRAAAETAANRHDWMWRAAGERYGLWSPERGASGLWQLPERARAAIS